MKNFFIIILVLLSLNDFGARAQRWALSTNVPDYVALGTLNIRGDAGVSQHWSVNSSMKYNPWTFHAGDIESQMENRQLTIAAAARYWPWNVFSGWWVESGLQYQEYNRGGISKPETEEGDAFGLKLAAGYTLMLYKNFNVDFGLGLWGGSKIFKVYDCPSCGRIKDRGTKGFVRPNELIVALAYIF